MQRKIPTGGKKRKKQTHMDKKIRCSHPSKNPFIHKKQQSIYLNKLILKYRGS
jgi:hypothetical protein